MKAQVYLKRIIEVDKLINVKVRELRNLKRLSGLKSSCWSDMPKSKNISDIVCDSVCEIIDLENEINKSIDKLVDMKRFAMNKIDSLEDNRIKIILIRKYFHNDTYQKIAIDLNLTYKWVVKLHNDGISELNKFF